MKTDTVKSQKVVSPVVTFAVCMCDVCFVLYSHVRAAKWSLYGQHGQIVREAEKQIVKIEIKIVATYQHGQQQF